MPTTEDIHEFLRRYFLKRESFLTSSTLKKIAEQLKGASFDDVNTFLGTLNCLNGAKMTDECTTYRPTYSDDENITKWCACLHNDPRMQKKHYTKIRCVGMPVSSAEVRGALKGTKSTDPFQPSVPESEVERHKTFKIDGKDAVNREKQNQHEVLPNLTQHIRAGKFQSRTQGAIMGYKYYDM